MKRLLAKIKAILRPSKGFTLIELLVVIGILGLLAVGALVALNPVGQFNRTKDATAKSSVGQVSSALQAYYATYQKYPTTAEWGAATNPLVASGDLKQVPSGITYSGSGTNASVDYPLLTSDTASTGCSTATPCTHFCWQSTTGKAQALPAATACSAP